MLLELAERADSRGCGAWQAAATMAATLGMHVSKIRAYLALLESDGLIVRGDQSLVEHIPGGHRPVVWNLCMDQVRSAADTADLPSKVARGGRPSKVGRDVAGGRALGTENPSTDSDPAEERPTVEGPPAPVQPALVDLDGLPSTVGQDEQRPTFDGSRDLPSTVAKPKTEPRTTCFPTGSKTGASAGARTRVPRKGRPGQPDTPVSPKARENAAVSQALLDEHLAQMLPARPTKRVIAETLAVIGELVDGGTSAEHIRAGLAEYRAKPRFGPKKIADYALQAATAPAPGSARSGGYVDRQQANRDALAQTAAMHNARVAAGQATEGAGRPNSFGLWPSAVAAQPAGQDWSGQPGPFDDPHAVRRPFTVITGEVAS
ncbi:hypothetical protein [Parafrankia discariae]|uniref:hypothetical protein n=1 Tax=Parafrankia discariae TaxID=365528 RepID=UPI0003A3F3B8